MAKVSAAVVDVTLENDRDNVVVILPNGRSLFISGEGDIKLWSSSEHQPSYLIGQTNDEALIGERHIRPIN